MPVESPSSTVQVLDHALRDSGADGRTRRWLLERVAIGAVGAAAGSALLRRVNLSSTVPAAVKAVFEGAYAAELDHFKFTRAHWHPTTTKFWIPDAFFGGSGNTVDLTAVGHALVAGETLFVNLYLIGVTTFAAAGNGKFARFSAELAGCESEHRVLAETLLSATPPNNVGFEVYSITRPGKIEKALEGAGVGFGTQGATPGAFYQLPHPPMAPPLPIGANKPS